MLMAIQYTMVRRKTPCPKTHNRTILRMMAVQERVVVVSSSRRRSSSISSSSDDDALLISRCSPERCYARQQLGGRRSSSHRLQQQQQCHHQHDGDCSPSHTHTHTHHHHHCQQRQRRCRQTPTRRKTLLVSSSFIFLVVFLSSLLISSLTTHAWIPPTTRSKILSASRRRRMAYSFNRKATSRIRRIDGDDYRSTTTAGPSFLFGRLYHGYGPQFSSSMSSSSCLLAMSAARASADSAEDDNDETASSTPTTTAAIMTATDRFHEDMRRVLDSRRLHFLQNQQQQQQLDDENENDNEDADNDDDPTSSRLPLQLLQSSSSTTMDRRFDNSNNNNDILHIQRRNRPIILNSDVDGAERVLTLLQVLCQRQMATETSFQIAMQAFVNRGRLRWKNNTCTTVVATAASGGATGSGGATSSSSFHAPNQNNNKDQIICAADQVEVLFHQLVQQQKDGRLQQQPGGKGLSIETYNLVLQAYAICATPRGGGERDYAQRAMEVLHEMERVFAGGHHDKIPVESLCHVLHAAAWQQANLQKDGYCWANVASRLLNRIVDQIMNQETTNKNNDNTTVIMSEANARHFMQCHAWTLEAWSKSGSAGSAQVADDLLSKMKQFYATLTATATANATSSSASQFLDAEAYSNAILAWSKASFDENVDIDDSTAAKEKSSSSVNSKSSSSVAAERAHALLMEMLDAHAAGSFPKGSEPPLIAFNGVISAWGRCGLPNKAADILTLLEEIRPTCRNLVPDVVSYNSVLHAFLRCPRHKVESANRVLDLVRYMEEHCKTQPAIQPNAFTYNTLMRCLIQSIDKRAAGTASNYNNNNNINDSVMAVVQEMEEALLKMERCWAQGDWSIEPSNRAFNMVINAYAKSSDRFAARKALDLFHRMIEASSPSSTSSSSSYYDSQEQHSPRRHFQNRLAYSFQPDIITVTSVMECLSKSTADPTAPMQAQELLAFASKKYKETQDTSWMPNLRSFTMAIMTHANNHNGSVVQARQLLTDLVQLYNETKNPKLLPNGYPYNYVLNCAANTIDKSMKLEAFQIATKTYQEMRQSSTVRPDSYTYAFWIKCCNNLLKREEVRNGARIGNGGEDVHDDLRSKCIKYAFEDCKKHGLLSSEVLNRLLQGSPRWLVDELLEWDRGSSESGNGNIPSSSSSPTRREQQPNHSYRKINIRDLPPSWSRNVARR